ncbi:MAG: restriction endonuclease subunit S [Roseburia sp.]|nr:restriction endonuclease subunit S [Roseburia sp.]
MNYVSIEELCEILNGYAFKSDNYVEEGVRIIRIANVQKGYIEDNTPVFCQYDNLELEKYMLMENDLLISLTGNVGRVALLTKEFLPAALNQRVACLRLKNKEVLKKYLFYCLSANGFEEKCIRSAKGVAQKNMSTEWLKKYKIPLYSSNEQIQIVRSLDFISRTINNRKKQLQKLDELIQARFVEVFGDPVINSKNLRTMALKDVLRLKAGDFTAASDISDKLTETNKYPCFGGNGIRGYVTEYNQEGEYSLIGRQGALSGNVQFAKGKFRNTEHALLVIPMVEMNDIWLNQLLINLDLKRYQTGAAQPGLSVKNLQEISIIMVPITEQNQFAAFVNQVNKSKLVIKNLLQIYKHQIQM